jgi:hypothetical protein
VSGLVALLATTAWAEDWKPPTAAEWRRHCDEYSGELGGATKSDDLAVTYCIGLTAGVVAGLRLGSQLGALGMASRLTVAYNLDSKAVFESFRQATPETLMQVCPPPGMLLRDYVLLVQSYLKLHRNEGQRPLPDVFFEALQASYPCDARPAKP